MVNRLYLDGCSYTYGLGLDPEQTLAHLFKHIGEYEVTNNSRNGKSNLAIAMDAYANCENYDIFLLGFTFSGRFYLKHQGQNIDFQPVFWEPCYGEKTNAEFFEQEYKEFHRHFYSLYHRPFCDQLSDFLIDSVCCYLKSQNKKVVAFSWENRSVKTELFYPYLPSKYLLPNNHYNADGTRILYDMLQERIENEQS